MINKTINEKESLRNLCDSSTIVRLPDMVSHLQGKKNATSLPEEHGEKNSANIHKGQNKKRRCQETVRHKRWRTNRNSAEVEEGRPRIKNA
jgi:hypothetical protein